MKKIILACGMLTLFASAAQAQAQRRTSSTTKITSKTAAPATPATTSTAVQGPAISTAITATSTSSTTDRSDPVKNGGMVIPDHAYEPAGTSGVGFFGNGTGGSTIGSTPEGGGTGVGATMSNGAKATTGKSTGTPNNATSR